MSADTRPLARRLLVPTLLTATMLALLVGLGTWQVERLHWKLRLLAEVDRAEASPPVPLTGSPGQFTKVEATGTLRGDKRAYYGVDVRGVTEGSQLVEPLERPGQDPVLVDLGWVPDGFTAYPSGPASVTGFVRVPSTPGLFTPAPNLARLHFYSLDPAAIGAALGLSRVAPFTVVAMGQGGPPEPADALPRPPNNHLGYAITWYGLAATLVVTYALFVRKTVRP